VERLKTKKRISKIIFGLTFLALLFYCQKSSAETGAYFSIGPVGLVQMGQGNRNFNAAPGVQFGGGYDWEKVGIRVRFLIGALEDVIPSGGVDSSVEFVNFGIDLKLYILDFVGYPEMPFRPYLVGGIGAYFLTEGSVNDNDNASGGGIVFGFGVDYRIWEYISIGLENDFHIIGLIEDTPEGHNGFSLFYYTVIGVVTLHF